MKKQDIIYILCSLVQIISIPLTFSVMLHADGPVWAVVLTGTLLTLLQYAKYSMSKKSWKRLLHTSCVLLYSISAVLLFLYIVIIPYPAYLAWFEMIGKKEIGGSISFLFVVGATYFSSLFCGLYARYGLLRPLAGLCFALSFLVTVILQSLSCVLMTLLMLLLSVVFTSLLPWKKFWQILVPLTKLSLLVLSLALLQTINTKQDTRWLFEYRIYPAVKQSIVRLFPESNFIKQAAGYGFFFDNESLGNKPSLSDAPIFEITAKPGSTIYLRAEAFDQYKKNSWSHGTIVLLEHAKRTEKEHLIQQKISRKPDITIKNLLDFYPLVPHTLSTNQIGIKTSLDVSLLYGTKDIGLLLTLPLVKGTTVNLEHNKPLDPNSYRSKILARAEKAIGRNILFQQGSETIAKKDLEPYLHVPANIAKTLRPLALDITRQNPVHWKKLYYIYSYLTKYYSFSLDTKKVPLQKDFIEDFLFVSKKGYSEHFASAFVILARLNQIPARYVTGFLVQMPLHKNKIIINGFSAHAWPEVWLPGLGWTSVEASPFMDPLYMKKPDFYSYFNRNHDELTARYLKSIMGTRIKPPEEKQRPVGFFSRYEKYQSYISILVYLTLLLLLYPLAPMFWRRRSPLKGTMKIFEKHVYALVRETQQVAPSPSAKGWMAWSDALVSRYPQEKNAILAARDLILQVFYTDLPVSRNAINVIKTTRTMLKKSL